MESSRDGLEGGGPSRRLSRTLTAGAFTDAMDPEVVPSSLAVIAPILRVANEIEEENPRIAYLCRFYAFDKAHKLDPSSAGRGVRQFKTALLHKLERDDDITRTQRKTTSDSRAMQNYYQEFYSKYVKSLVSNTGANMDRAYLVRTYQMAAVLFDVLKAVNQTELDPQIMAAAQEVDAKKEIYVAYNILPLDPTGASEAIMMFPEIKAAVTALRNIRGLPWLLESRASRQKGTEIDLFDWLQSMFGFQKDNVANQREHLILLLANIHMRQVPKPDALGKLSDAALSIVMERLFKNYRRWCKFLNRRDHLQLPSIQQEIQQRKILYIGLYLLIWGEAANLRFMPESLCYIFHHMAGELYGTLAGAVSSVTGENVKPTYGGGNDSFLAKVVTPIYNVIQEEVRCNENGRSCHSVWCNYDDLNEYFWSIDCFRLGWPMRMDRDFFKNLNKKSEENQKPVQRNVRENRQSFWVGKINFVEVRSFFHVFRSFDRMWSFFILSLQAMIIIAWNSSGSVDDVFNGTVFEKVLSIFITAAFLRLIQAVVDIALSFKARRNMKYTDMLRYVLKVMVAMAWVIVLPVCYAHSWGDSTGFVSTLKNWFGQSRSLSLYVTAIIVYLSPDAVSALLFLFPMLRRGIEQSNLRIVQLLLWWAQPPMYIGRGMHESPYVLFKYTLFWVLLLTSKFLFSYYMEIKPLVEPTKHILSAHMAEQYQWHEMFPREKYNLGVIIAVWAPIIMVYFMDTQIWYAIWSTIFGGINGAFSRLGEIRTLEMLRSRFRSLPGAFNANLVSPSSEEKSRVRRQRFSLRKSYRPLDELYEPHNQQGDKPLDEVDQLHDDKENARKISNVQVGVAKFSQLWNAVIKSIRQEDYIKNDEMELLLIPQSSDLDMRYIQWPPFLLANKIASVLDMVKDLSDRVNDEEIIKRIDHDPYMKCAIVECYDLFTVILRAISKGDCERMVVEKLIKDVQDSIAQRALLKSLRMSALPLFFHKIVDLVKILEKPDIEKVEQVTFLLQDLLEVYIRDVKKESDPEMLDASRRGHLEMPEEIWGVKNRQLFEKDFIEYPLKSDSLNQKIKRLHLLLTTEEFAADVPSNSQARHRITFFANSLFMDMPPPPTIHDMLSFSVLTPYDGEEVVYTQKGLLLDNDDGVSILYYLQKIYPDEWKNFLERTNCGESELWNNVQVASEVCKWASYRAQTLSRTVRGMMYYQKALELQAFFDMAQGTDIVQGHEVVLPSASDNKSGHPLLETIRAVTDMKFTYVVTCQNYGLHKRTKDPRADEILHLLQEYPTLRVAYVDEVGDDKNTEYYSVLTKGVKGSDIGQVIYKIKLPGKPILGEGKAENQNHAIIFTRGEALQAIDMNQDYYLEEAFKMRNLLQEFLEDNGVGSPSLLGMREHVFTGSVSSLAGFMSNQESTFVTIGQRVLANPLKVRFHYGHPDVFDRLFHLTRGGISKASRGVNLSQDIFAGFNTTLRRGNVTHHEYIQVGKGRYMGLNQISLYEAKIAIGNGEQTMSRDVYRLGHRVDFFRMLSVYFTTIGLYVNSLIAILIAYIFLYGRIYLALSGLEASLVQYAGLQDNMPLQVAMALQSFVLIGFLIALPMVMEIGLERGFRTALSEFIIMQLQLASVFFTFSMGTKVHFYGRTLLHGGAKYRPTGGDFVVFHAKFAENYRLYSRSHFTKGLELLILLIIYDAYGASVNKTVPYILISFLLWFLIGTWLFAPFLFNPSGFEWQKIVEDWEDWNKWISNRGGIGVPPEKSWESWWEEEQAHLGNSGLWGQAIEILLSGRFLLYQYGLVYHLHITQHHKSIAVYILSWLVIVFVLGMLKVVSVGRQQFSAEYQLLFRLLKGGLFLAGLTILIVLFVAGNLMIGDLFVSALAFLPSGWALVQIAQACRQMVRKIRMWDSVKALARGYEYLMGVLLFAPVAALAWFPFISDFQTRLLFNQAFSRGLQISRILAGRKDKKMN